MSDSIAVTERSGAVRFGVRVQPRAARSGLDGAFGMMLKVRLTAPPVDDAANEALVALLADALAVPKRDVQIVAGRTSRSKTVEVAGITAAQVQALATGERPRHRSA